MIENDWSLSSFDTLIVTNRDETDWDGIPDIKPVVGLSDRPIGRDPDEIENERSSPSTLGVIENELFNVRA